MALEHPNDPALLESIRAQSGETFAELSRRQPLLVVFLRHSGCTFCRQALSDLAQNRAAIAQAGAGIALVHMQTDAEAAKFFADYGLADVARISDPNRTLYRAFELTEGTLAQVAGPGVWAAGAKSLLTGHLPGVPSANVFQLPGAFLVHNGEVVRAFRGRTSAERPDYCELATSPASGR